MQFNITMTEHAKEYIQKKLHAANAKGLRLSIKKTGCSGYAYVPDIVSDIKETDFVVQINALTIYIDPAWAHLLGDMQIDFQEEEKTGLKQKRLVFINPKEASRCGCGESFNLE